MPSKHERLTSRIGCKDRCVGHSVARHRAKCRSAPLLPIAALVALTAFAPGAARAQDATWLLDPTSDDFKTAANWTPATVPSGTAFFGTSDTTALTFSTGGAAGGWTFNAGASAYTFANSQAYTFTGAGIVINGGSASITNTDDLTFLGASTAGRATITNDNSIIFNTNSTAGNATINNANFGAMTFNNSSTAGSATITNKNNVFFESASTAGSATITNDHNIFFSGASTAGNATITNNATIQFEDRTTAGSAAITNNSGATVDFSGSTGPAGDNKLTAGSIAGAGLFQLGANELTVGGNNMSTDVSGIIAGIGGSLVKVGTGALTLSGSSSLSGTTIEGGTLTVVNGGTLNASDTIVVGSTAGSSGILNIGAGGSASALNLVVGQSGVGTLAVQNGGTLTDFGGSVGELPGSQGTATVSGAGSTWTNNSDIVVGGLGTGTLNIQDGGTLNSRGGGSIGMSAGSTGTVTVTGPGSTWNNSPGGGLNIGSFGTGMLAIANGGMVINTTDFAANIGNGAGSLGTVTVTGAGSTWSNSSGLNIGNLGTGTLTIANGGVVTSAGPIVIATNAGSIGTLNIGAGAGNPAVAPGTLTAPSVAFGAGTGTINFNHTSADYVFAPAISGDGALNVLAGITTLTAANSYSGATNVVGGSLRAGALNTFSPNSALTVAGGGTLDLNGFNQTLSSLANAGLVNMGAGAAPGTVLTTTSYAGTGGTIAINTFLEGDGSPSDRLIINGGAGTGATTMHVTNILGPGAETTGNGILVVEAINGAATSPGAFMLSSGELRGGVFNYDLFRGGVSGSPNDWFLRSDFVVTGPPGEVLPPETSPPTTPVVPPVVPPVTSLPTDPPPNPLPPGVYPIIGPELATYGVVQPLARQLGVRNPRHARRPGRRHLRAGWLRRYARGPAERPADQETGAGACALSALLAIGLGPLLRPNARQPLSRLRRSARQRQSGRLPGRHRSSAGISDRRPL